MKNFKNIIITLSGDPVSGKSTVRDQLKDIYTDAGYKVHVVSVGEIFRKRAVAEYKKMFPEIENPSIEEINSNDAFGNRLQEIDSNLDEQIEELGKEIDLRYRPGQVYIIDSRMAFHMIPDSFSVRLTVDPKVAGERAFNDKTRGPEEQYSSLQEAIEDTESRKNEEIERYKKQYGVDLTDHNNFDLIIETTLANIADIADTIKVCEECHRNEEKFAKTWASPELFYPTQDIRTTCSNSPFMTAGLTPMELAESIKKNGIYPDAPVSSTTISNSAYQFVADGHHRVIASILAGRTLIPYEAKRHTDKATVRSLSNIYDHEDIHRPDGSIFRYKEYPEIDRESDMHDR